MVSLIFVHKIVTLAFGASLLILGLVGTLIQLLTMATTRYYRKTPCTFYFIVASIHECGLFISSSGPLVYSALFNADAIRISLIWCKLRFFLATSFATIPLTCSCLSTIDHYLATSRNKRYRQLSNMTNAYRASLFVVIIWWLHGTLYIYFRGISPTTNICVYWSHAFYTYAILFLCVVLCGAHILIMMIFGTLAYRNMKSVAALSRRHADRQLAILVFIQIVLTLIGLIPYGIFNTYRIVTINLQKTTDEKLRDALVGTITYFLGSLTYGGRFYIFICSSPRFRRAVTDRIFWWRQRPQLRSVRVL